MTDVDGCSRFNEQLHGISTPVDGLFERARTENIAQAVLHAAAAECIRSDFQVEVAFKDGVLDRLATVARLFEHRPVTVTPELIAGQTITAPFAIGDARLSRWFFTIFCNTSIAHVLVEVGDQHLSDPTDGSTGSARSPAVKC